MSNLLALDQASQVTGWSLFIDGKYIKCGKIVLDDHNVDRRLVQLRNSLIQLITTYAVNEIVFEEIQQQQNVQTFKVLAQVYGVVAELAEELGIPHSTIVASSWKSSLGVKGRNRAEQKRDAQRYVLETYGLKPTQDEVDSICIGTAHLKKEKCAW